MIRHNWLNSVSPFERETDYDYDYDSQASSGVVECWSVGVLGKNRLNDNTKRGKVRRSFPATFTELGTMDSGLEFKTITPLLHYSINPSSYGMTLITIMITNVPELRAKRRIRFLSGI